MKIADAQKYIDAALKLLDPRFRELAPAAGDMGCSVGAIKGVDMDQRTVTALVSTPNPDRYEEIVDPAAFKAWLSTFMSNPVFVAGHNYGGRSGEPTVIGHWTKMQITEEGLEGTAKFARTDLAEQYWQLYAEGHMRAFSVGWLTHAWEMKEFELAKGVRKKIRVFTEVELIEVSAVAIPANRESLVRAASAFNEPRASASGLNDTELRKLIADEITKTLTDPLGPVDSLIREVVAAVHAHGSCGHHDDDLDERGTEPDRAPGSEKGTDANINRQLEETLAAMRR